MITVFLGGSCAGTDWRIELTPKLDATHVKLFNPASTEWNEEMQTIEDWHKEHDDLYLYCITPEIIGYYCIYELGLSCGRKPNETILCILNERNGKQLSPRQTKVFLKIYKDTNKAGAHVFDNLDDVAKFINSYAKTFKK